MQSRPIQSSSALTRFKFDLTAVLATFAPTPLQIRVSLNIPKWRVEQLEHLVARARGTTGNAQLSNDSALQR